MQKLSSTAATSERDPYRHVIVVLLLLAAVGAGFALVAGVALPDRVLLDVFVSLVLATGCLLGVAGAQRERLRSSTPSQQSMGAAPASAPSSNSRWRTLFAAAGPMAVGTAVAGLLSLVLVQSLAPPASRPGTLATAVAAGACLAAAGLGAMAAHYLSGVDLAGLPEATGLARGARTMGWILGLAAVSTVLAWAGQRRLVDALHLVVLSIDVAVCWGLCTVKRSVPPRPVFPLDLGVLSVLGNRANVLASGLDAAQRQLGIDLRSTWALTVVRRTVEPLAIVLCLLGWLTTSLSIVGVQEEALVERLGVPVGRRPLRPGLHLHWPWPIDRVFRFPVRSVQALAVGHEGEKEPGPENVLWARQHASNEYTLLLGDGRDLITIDAAVQFRIKDLRAWHYHCQNPVDALRAIAYRAVMRSTVDRTLAQALSENAAALTGQMRDLVQRDADALGLGAEVVAFTLEGMHPPVAVATDYQAVVSAELGKVTATVEAQAFRNDVVPAAEAAVTASVNTARAEGAEALGRAAGEAWSFRALQAQYAAAPQEFRFRRRLETLEKGLTGRRTIVVDSRFQRDGGELWVMP